MFWQLLWSLVKILIWLLFCYSLQNNQVSFQPSVKSSSTFPQIVWDFPVAWDALRGIESAWKKVWAAPNPSPNPSQKQSNHHCGYYFLLPNDCLHWRCVWLWEILQDIPCSHLGHSLFSWSESFSVWWRRSTFTPYRSKNCIYTQFYHVQ